MVMTTKSPQGSRLNPQNTLELSQGMSIQTAVNTADAHGGQWVLLLYPGANYNEGDITPSGASDITIKAMGEGIVTIAPVAAPVAGVIVSGGNLTLEDVTVVAPDATMPPIRVTAGLFHSTRCTFSGVGAGDVIQQVGGTVHLDACETTQGDFNLATGICTLIMHGGHIANGDIITAGALAHDITLTSADIGNGNITNGATGATVVMIQKCYNITAFTDASLLGTITLEATVFTAAIKTGTSPWIARKADFVILSNTNATGAITCYGGLTFALNRAVGPIVLWENSTTLHVKPCTTITDTIIQWAVNAAGAGDTIAIYPGTYEEAVVLAAGISLKGTDKENCIINMDHAVLITMAAGCTVSGLLLVVTSDNTNVGTGIELNDATCTIEDVYIVLHRTGGVYATGILESTGATARTINIRNVHCSMTNNTNERGIAILQAGKTIYIEESWIQGSDYGMAIGVSGGAAIASTIYSFGNYFEATSAHSRSVYCNGGVIYLRGDTVVYGVYCEGAGGAVRMRDTSYKSLHRAGVGNIVDESPDLKDAPWHVQRWSFQTALAQSQVTVRGTPDDAGTGQVMLEVTDDGADAEAVESGTILAGSLTSKLTPARTPRYLVQISVDSFDAHVTMFFGLRETLGAAVPAATEDHAGFIWDGTNFKASSDDGVAIQATNLDTPSEGAQHQLEVIVFGGVTTVGWVEFLVDGALVATHVTRIPVDALDWQKLLATAGAGGGDIIQVTVRNGGAQECPA